MSLILTLASAMAADCTDPHSCLNAAGLVPDREDSTIGIGPQGNLVVDGWSLATWTDKALGQTDPRWRLWSFMDGDEGSSGKQVACGSPQDTMGMDCIGQSDTAGIISNAPGDVGVSFVTVDVSSKMQAAALDSTGKIWAWGANTFNFVADAPTAANYVDVSVGYYMGIGVRASDGELDFFGHSPPWADACESFVGDVVKADSQNSVILAVLDTGELKVCGNPAWADLADYQAKAPQTHDVLDVECNDFGPRVCVAWHTDHTITIWQDAAGLTSEALIHSISYNTSRSFRSVESYQQIPKITDDHVCGVVEASNGQTFWDITHPDGVGFHEPHPGQGLCWGRGSSSANQPRTIGRCD